MADEEPEDLALRLSTLHKKLLTQAKKSRTRGKTHYDKVVRETLYEIGDGVLM